MKKLILAIISLWIFSVTNISAQSAYDLNVEQEVIGTDLHLSLYATKVSGSDFAFGSCNFAITIDTANLDLNNMSYVTKGIWDNSVDANSYLSMFLGKGPNFINVNTRRKTNGSGSGQLLTNTKTLIAKIAIPIKNSCGTNSSTWVSGPAAQNKFPRIDIKSNANFVNPQPNFPLCAVPAVPYVSNNGNDTICQGSSTILSTNFKGDVQWYKDGIALSGATDTVLNVNSEGYYTVEAINCLCKTMSLQGVQIIVNPLPNQPIITQLGNQLQTGVSGQFQWYLNGIAIAGAVNDTVTIQGDGVYTVEAINNCGSVMSDPFSVTSTGLVSQFENSINAFPNPFMKKTQIKITLAEASNVQARVFDVLGKDLGILIDGKYPKGEFAVEFNSEDYVTTSEGVYFVKLRLNDTETMLKLVEVK